MNMSKGRGNKKGTGLGKYIYLNDIMKFQNEQQTTKWCCSVTVVKEKIHQ